MFHPGLQQTHTNNVLPPIGFIDPIHMQHSATQAFSVQSLPGTNDSGTHSNFMSPLQPKHVQ
jgi:hypothetical protein